MDYILIIGFEGTNHKQFQVKLEKELSFGERNNSALNSFSLNFMNIHI